MAESSCRWIRTTRTAQMTRSLLRRGWVILAILAGCSGGQSGEPGSGQWMCFDASVEGGWFPAAEDSNDVEGKFIELDGSENMGAEWAGLYQAPLYWVDTTLWYVFGHRDPDQTERTELTVELTRKDGLGRWNKSICPGWIEIPWVPVGLAVRTADGRQTLPTT